MEHPENNNEYKGLVVNKGVAQPPSVNPYRVKRKKSTLLTSDEFVKEILSGNIVVLSQAVTLIERLVAYLGNGIRHRISPLESAGATDNLRLGIVIQNTLAVCAEMVIVDTDRDLGEVVADREGKGAYIRNRRAKGQRCQGRAVIEGLTADGRQGRGQADGGDPGALGEGTLPDLRCRGGKGDTTGNPLGAMV